MIKRDFSRTSANSPKSNNLHRRRWIAACWSAASIVHATTINERWESNGGPHRLMVLAVCRAETIQKGDYSLAVCLLTASLM